MEMMNQGYLMAANHANKNASGRKWRIWKHFVLVYIMYVPIWKWLKNVTFILTVFLFCVMVLKSNFSCSMSNRESDKILHRNICIYYWRRLWGGVGWKQTLKGKDNIHKYKYAHARHSKVLILVSWSIFWRKMLN